MADGITKTDKEFLIYTAGVCPYAQRALLALEESGLTYEPYAIDLQNKPSWYNTKVNEASKVPVLVINPGKQNEYKLPESLVIVEYIADVKKDGILPEDPLTRARIRYLIERYTQLVGSHWSKAHLDGDASSLPKLVEGLARFQDLLFSSSNQGPFFLGQRYSEVELAISPFIGRMYLLTSKGLLAGEKGSKEVYDKLTSPEFARLKKWLDVVSARPSWAKTFDEEAIIARARAKAAARQAAAAKANSAL